MVTLIWVKIYLPVWSFIVNCVYWIFRLHKIKSAFDKKKSIKKRINGVGTVKSELDRVIYTVDKWKDWVPWVITLIDSDLKDDCDGAAKYAKWLFSIIGINGNILCLLGEKTGHAVFVTMDKKIMTTNNSMKFGNWTDQTVLKYFKFKYTKMI